MALGSNCAECNMAISSGILCNDCAEKMFSRLNIADTRTYFAEFSERYGVAEKELQERCDELKNRSSLAREAYKRKGKLKMRKIGYAQFRPEFGAFDTNIHIIENIAKNADTDLLVFPELCTTGYEFKNRDEASYLAEPFKKGPLSVLLQRLAAETMTTIVAGYAEKDGETLYNSSLLAKPNGELHNYRKIHLFDREKNIFTKGDKVPEVIETPAGRVGMMICFDWLFPEVSRMLAMKGAQIIAHPSNLVLQFCQRAMFARCIENGVFAVTTNRYGTEERTDRSLTFTGASQVMSNKGEELISAPSDDDHVGIVEVNPEDADDKMITSLNHRFNDMRVNIHDNSLLF
jgi:predicted amidohydrolase